MIGASFGLIVFAQSRQPLLESMRSSLADVVSNMTDVVSFESTQNPISRSNLSSHQFSLKPTFLFPWPPSLAQFNQK